MSSLTYFAGAARDIRQAGRMLRLKPLFALTVILTIALGIGATTTVFTVVNGVIIKPLPYPDSDAVVTVGHSAMFGGVRNDTFPFSPQLLEIYLNNSESFEEIGIYRGGQATIAGIGEPEQTPALLVSAGALRALRVQPSLGRWFSDADDRPAAAEMAILSNEYWQRRFGGDPGVIGRVIDVDGRLREVIGVMPSGFGLRGIAADLILPLRIDLAAPRADFGFAAVARLRPGVTVDQANTDSERLVPMFIDKYGVTAEARTALLGLQLQPAIRSLKDDVVGNVGQFLWVLLGSIGIVLLIACANVANLMLVRTESRTGELAVRTAMGAGWRHLARGLMAESVTLSLVGGMAGIGLAYGGLRILLALQPANLPRLNEIAIDLNVLGFAVAMSLATGLLFGLLPVVQLATRRFASNLAEYVHGGGRWASSGKRQQRSQNALVVAQVALALVMLVSAGLMFRTFQNVLGVDPGFANPATIQTVRITMPDRMWLESDRVARIQEQILDRLAAIPGVTAAGYIGSAPMENRGTDAVIAAEDVDYGVDGYPPNRRTNWIAPGTFRALGTPLVAGRDFDWVEIHEQRGVALVSAGFARESWSSVEGALGKRIRVEPEGPWQEVVGVVADVYDDGAHLPAPPTVYFPARRMPYVVGDMVPLSVAFVLRTDRTGTASLLSEIRQAVAEVAPELPIAQVGTLAEFYDESMARTSLALVLLGIAGGMALLLSIVGIYGVLAYAVMQRQREVGIRVALGATPGTVRAMFVRRGMALSGIGIAVGAVIAAVVTRSLSSLLFGVAPIDGPTFVLAAVFLAVAAFLASYVPARRAAALMPTDTLRS